MTRTYVTNLTGHTKRGPNPPSKWPCFGMTVAVAKASPGRFWRATYREKVRGHAGRQSHAQLQGARRHARHVRAISGIAETQLESGPQKTISYPPLVPLR